MISKFLDLFRKKKVKQIGFTTTNSDVGFTSKEELFEIIRKKPQVTHNEINALSHLYFDVTFKNTFYKFRNSVNYGQYFQIEDFYLITDISKTGLTDIVIVLRDVAMDTTMKIHISVKELNEVFESFVPDFNFMIKS